MDIEERDIEGHAVRGIRTPTLLSPGLSIQDVGQAWGPQTRRVYLRLIVGGGLSGASCDYAWVRFVRREDVSKLQANSHLQRVVLEP